MRGVDDGLFGVIKIGDYAIGQNEQNVVVIGRLSVRSRLLSDVVDQRRKVSRTEKLNPIYAILVRLIKMS